MKHTTLTSALALAFTMTVSSAASALEWSDTEIQYQRGKLDIATFAGGGDENVDIFTFQHANGWKYGDNFLFVDFSDQDKQGSDIYGELYSNFSLGKITGNKVGFGAVKDIGIIAGYNWGDEAKVRKYLPGIRFDMDFESFNFFHIDVTAYIDDNSGVGSGGAPKEDDSYMIDISYSTSFSFGEHDFSIEGHMEYIGERDNEFGQKVEGHFLAQPQVRYDLGKTLFNKKDKFHVGIEYQMWQNKLGDKNTDENAVQFLAVYNF